MNSSKITSHAFKGIFLNLYFDLRKTLKISTIVVVSIALFDFVMVSLFLRLNEDMSNDATGILLFGTIAMIIAFCVYVVLSTSKEKLREKFSFPVNRKIFAISNFLFYMVGSFILLGILTILAPIEVLLYKLLEVMSDKFMFLNFVTLESYFVGLISAWAIMIAIGSLTYCLSLYIRKYLQYSLPLITITFASIFLFGWFIPITEFLFLEENLLLFVLNLLMFSIICHGIGYIALSKTEVE